MRVLFLILSSKSKYKSHNLTIYNYKILSNEEKRKYKRLLKNCYNIMIPANQNAAREDEVPSAAFDLFNLNEIDKDDLPPILLRNCGLYIKIIY
jgi:ferredoxin-fold anticodon binding domain-containing protein